MQVDIFTVDEPFTVKVVVHKRLDIEGDVEQFMFYNNLTINVDDVSFAVTFDVLKKAHRRLARQLFGGELMDDVLRVVKHGPLRSETDIKPELAERMADWITTDLSAIVMYGATSRDFKNQYKYESVS